MFLLLIEDESEREFVNQLYEQYKNLVFTCAYEILQDKQLSEDALQETFIRVMQNLDKIGEIVCPKTRGYLVTICRNVSINIYNQRKHVRSMNYDMGEGFEPSDSRSNPQEILLSQDNIARVKNAIKQLKPIYRDVFALKEAFEYTDDEICEMLHITLETLRKRVLRGRLMLKDILAKEGLR